MNKEIKSIFRNIPTILTERLILRRIRRSDIADIYDYARRDETPKFLLWYPHHSLSVTKDYYRIINKKYKQGTFYDWGIVDQRCGKMIGTCGFTRIDTVNNKGELGYVINPDFAGRGLATEAVKRVIEFGFDFLGLERLECRYMKENLASRRVMEKCHMQYEGILRHSAYAKGKYYDIGVCAITAGEYRKLVSTGRF